MNFRLPDTVERWPLARLLPYAANARTHPDEQIAQIAGSIAEFGFNVPCLVDDRGVLIAGHGRLLAAKRLGLQEVPVIRLGHLTDAQARAFRLADNRIALNAGWDEALLAAELSGSRKTVSTSSCWALGRTSSTGCSTASIKRGASGEEDEVPEPPTEAGDASRRSLAAWARTGCCAATRRSRRTSRGCSTARVRT